MKKFDEVLIKGKKLMDIHISSIDRMVIQKYRFARKLRNLQKKLYL